MPDISWRTHCLPGIVESILVIDPGIDPKILVCQEEINTLRREQNGLHFADDIFKCIFLNEIVWRSIEIFLKFVPEGPLTIRQHWFKY